MVILVMLSRYNIHKYMIDFFFYFLFFSFLRQTVQPPQTSVFVVTFQVIYIYLLDELYLGSGKFDVFQHSNVSMSAHSACTC